MNGWRREASVHAGVPGDQIEIREVEPNDFYISYDGEIHTRRDPTTDMYYFNAYVDQELVGSIHARPRHDLGTMVIYEAFVKPEYRSSPAFMKLVNAVQEVSGGLPLEGYGIANPRLRDLYNRRYTGWVRESHNFELRGEKTDSGQFGDSYVYRLYADGTETDGDIFYTVSNDQFEPTVWVNSVFVPGDLRGTNAFLTLLEPIFALKRDGWKIEALFANPRLGELYERWMRRQGAVEDYYYHLAPSSERNRILQHGLHPSDPTESDHWDPTDALQHQPVGIYVLSSPDEIRRLWSRENRLTVGPSHGDIWRIPKNQVQPGSIGLDEYGEYFITHPVTAELYEPWEEFYHEDRARADERTQDWIQDLALREGALDDRYSYEVRNAEQGETFYFFDGTPAERRENEYADETVLNAYDGDKIIGTLIGGGGRRYGEDGVFSVVNVYVDPAYRNTTALYDLILAAKQMATSRGLILRGSSILNEKLLRVYERWLDRQSAMNVTRRVESRTTLYSEGASREERGRWSRIAMPLGPEEGQNFKAQRPWLYHQTDREYIPKILDEGLKPRTETGVSQYEGGPLVSYPDHVYLREPKYRNSDPPILVKTEGLDPLKFMPDEDLWMRDYGRDVSPNRAPTLPQWIDENKSMEHWSEEWTLRSMEQRGTIAYRGAIGPEHIFLNPEWYGLQAFLEGHPDYRGRVAQGVPSFEERQKALTGDPELVK